MLAARGYNSISIIAVAALAVVIDAGLCPLLS